MQVAKHQVVISRQFCSPYTNVQLWTEPVSWMYADINEWPLTQRISVPGVRAIAPLHTPASFQTCALKSLKWIVDSLPIILRRAPLISSTNSGHSALCRMPLPKTRSEPTQHAHPFLLRSTHQHKHPHPTMGKFCLLNARVEEFSPIAQLNIIRTKTLSRRDSNNVQGISFGFLHLFAFFP